MFCFLLFKIKVILQLHPWHIAFSSSNVSPYCRCWKCIQQSVHTSSFNSTRDRFGILGAVAKARWYYTASAVQNICYKYHIWLDALPQYQVQLEVIVMIKFYTSLFIFIFLKSVSNYKYVRCSNLTFEKQTKFIFSDRADAMW